MFKWPIVAATVALAIGLQPAAGEVQEIETIFAIPSQTLTFATHYVAHDAGFFKKEGVKVTDRYLVGVASPNAVLVGSADFTTRLIQEKPDEVLTTILTKRFPKMEPQLLAEAWKIAQNAHAKDIRVVVAQLENSQKVSLVGKLLDPQGCPHELRRPVHGRVREVAADRPAPVQRVCDRRGLLATTNGNQP